MGRKRRRLNEPEHEPDEQVIGARVCTHGDRYWLLLIDTRQSTTAMDCDALRALVTDERKTGHAGKSKSGRSLRLPQNSLVQLTDFARDSCV
jgi:hypothetical protein